MIFRSAVVPGYIFRVIGQERIFKLVLGAYLLAFLLFFVFLGYPASTVAFMTMLSAHVTSIAQLIKHLTPHWGLKLRLFSTLAVFLILNFFIYGLTRGALARVFMPLRINGEIVVVRACSIKSVRVGDFAAYRIESDGGSFRDTPIRITSGFGLDRVLGRERQTVRFHPDHFTVNDQKHPRQPRMPGSGEFTILPGELFVWPSFSVNNNYLQESRITEAVLSYARISEDNLVGKPCKYWFWRKQL